MRYHFDVLRLWEIPQEQVLSSPDYTLWPLAGLMGGATPEITIQLAERIATVSLDEVHMQLTASEAQ